MNVHIDAVGEVKQGKVGPYFSAKVGNTWWNVSGGEQERQRIAGKTCAVVQRPSNNPKYNGWLKIDAVEEPKAPEPQAGNGQDKQAEYAPPKKPSWAEFSGYVEQFHNLALALEPDGYSADRKQITESGTFAGNEVIVIDRSRARAAIINTLIIAHGKGQFDFDREAESEEQSPF